LYDRASLIQ